MKSNRCGGVRIESGRESLISSGGAAMLVQAAAVSGLAGELSRALSPWRMARSLHDPGKTALDLVVAIALGGDCLADAAVVRAQPEVFGTVASDPTISRLIDALGDDSAAAIAAIRGARAAARSTVWDHRSPVLTHRSGGGRSGCHTGRRALGEGRCDPELQAGLRVPPHVCLR